MDGGTHPSNTLASPIAGPRPACLIPLVGETIEEAREGRRSAQTTLELQIDVLGGLDTIAEQVDQVVAFLRPDRKPRTDEPLRVEERLASSRQMLHDRVLSRLGDDAASPSDLPVVAALL